MASNAKQIDPKPIGRPPVYNPSFIQVLIDFFDKEPYKTKDGKRIPNDLPTVVGFARHIKVALSTIYTWLDSAHPSCQPEFMETLARLVKPSQKEHLMQCGLLGLYNANFAKFIATNLTDLKDKTDVDVTIGHYDHLSMPQLEQRLAQIDQRLQLMAPTTDDIIDADCTPIIEDEGHALPQTDTE